MRWSRPRTRLGVFRTVVVVAEVVLIVLAIGPTGAIAGIRDRLDELNRSPESRGAQAYQQSCAGCHGGATGGSTAGLPPKHNANGHTWQHADCELVAMIRDGIAAPRLPALTAPLPLYASEMPDFSGRLDDDEIRDVIAFIKTMWTDDQRAAQRQTTRERCGP
jgi:mono/diheme cytochrome c family protein